MAKTIISSSGTVVRHNPDVNLGNMANNKRAAKRQQRETSSVKSVDSTPTPSVSPDVHAQSATPNSSINTVAPLTTDIETFTSLRDKLVQRMREEIRAAEVTLAELNHQFASLFPELADDDQPTPKPKKPKPKTSSKPEPANSEEAATSAE